MTGLQHPVNRLRAYLPGEEAAENIAYAWTGLSRATHLRPCELDPTREELTWLVEAADRAVTVLSGQVRRAVRD